MNGSDYYEKYDPFEIFGAEKPTDSENCKKCTKCLSAVTLGESRWPLTMTFMVVCQDCGNKRCPKATDHDLECTGSNEPGQKGSRYA